MLSFRELAQEEAREVLGRISVLVRPQANKCTKLISVAPRIRYRFPSPAENRRQLRTWVEHQHATD